MISYRDSPAKKTDILQLDMSGRFAINVVDNLVMVHHQASKVSNYTLDFIYIIVLCLNTPPLHIRVIELDIFVCVVH